MYLLLGGMQAILKATEGIDTPSKQYTCLVASFRLFQYVCHKKQKGSSVMLVKYCFPKIFCTKKKQWSGAVAHNCNPSYLRGRDQEDHSSQSA
jgi:hypothetical protein